MTRLMPNCIRTVAVVLAGGTGSRVGLDIPKQLIKIAGQPIIKHTVEALHDCAEIDEIIVMMTEEFVPDAEELLLGGEFPKLTRVLPGGADRNATTRAALDVIAATGDGTDCNVLLHDAVRPLVSRRIIHDCVVALQRNEAVDVAIVSADTIIRVDEHDHIAEIPDRSRLRRGQTPQGFRLSTIRRAYAAAASDPGFAATDDCGVVARYLPDVPIAVVAGDEENMKVTYPIDIFLADKLFQLSSRFAAPRSAQDLATALTGKTVVVLGGSYGIGADVARLAGAAGSRVFVFSRSTTGTYLEDPDSVRAALRQAADATGRIDAVVVGAAQLSRGRLVDLDDEEIQRQVQVNFVGPITAARASEPYLRESRGHLVMFTSSSYTRGRAGYSVYSSAKAGIVNLGQALSDEWSAAGIKVNVINPERTRTPMRQKAFGDEPENTLLESEAVAFTVLDVLISDLSGHVIDVRRDGVGAPESSADRIAEAVAIAELEAAARSLPDLS